MERQGLIPAQDPYCKADTHSYCCWRAIRYSLSGQAHECPRNPLGRSSKGLSAETNHPSHLQNGEPAMIGCY